MKGKFLFVSLASIALCLVVAFAGHTAEQKGQPTIEGKDVVKFPLVLTFKKPEPLKKSNFSVITFSHVQHQKVACGSCHHMWDGSSDIQSCSADGCHDEYGTLTGTMSYFKAFHARDAEYSCYGCHLRLNKELTAQGKQPLKISPCQNNICHKRDEAKK
jgi:hypothetical protein